MATELQPEEQTYNPWLVAIVVSLAAFMEVLDTTITNVSLSHIAGNLGASRDESTWVLTSYLVANGIVLPLSGWLSGLLGRKRYFMLCIGAFTAASFLCGIAGSLETLIFFRLLQGLAGGGLQPTQQAIILDAFPPQKRAAAFGITGITMIVAPILGPTLGGFITDNYSWRWIFFMNVPVGLMAFLLVGRMVVDPPHARAAGSRHIDMIGLGLIATGLGCLQIVLDKGQQEDWFDSNFILCFAVASAVCLVSAVVWMLKQTDPIVDLRLLGKPSFGLSCLMIFFTGFALYASSALLPLMLQSEFGYDATLAGLVLSPGGLAVVFLMPLSGRLVGYIQARYLVALGMVLCSFGMYMTTRVSPESDYHMFTIMRITQVLGLPFLFIPISTLAFKDIPKEKSNKASALYALARNIGGSIGIALLASYVARHEQYNQHALARHMTPFDTGYRFTFSAYVKAMTDKGMQLSEATAAATGRMYRELLHQSSLISYNDAYTFLSLCLLCVSGIALCMPRNDPHAKKSAAAEGAAH